MAKKPAADLAASGLLVTKGAAVAPKDAPQRGAQVGRTTETVPVADAEPPADKGLVPLQFRVSAKFREEFEVYAFNSKPRRKMVDVLKAAFEALKEKEGRR